MYSNALHISNPYENQRHEDKYKGKREKGRLIRQANQQPKPFHLSFSNTFIALSKKSKFKTKQNTTTTKTCKGVDQGFLELGSSNANAEQKDGPYLFLHKSYIFMIYSKQ